MEDIIGAIAVMIPIVGILAVFVGLPWVVLHYVTRWRERGRLTPADERMLEDLWRSARDISRRMEAIERILDIAPDAERRTHHHD